MPGADAKTRLYETALGLMGRQGISATSTREIIAAAGIRNPSTISYHFGSKAELVEALTREIQTELTHSLELQTKLTASTPMPTAHEWVAPVIDTATTLVASERGCLLARLWWEFDGYLQPQALEAFLSGPSEIAGAWRAAVVEAFPQLPPQIGLARNVTMLRTIGWTVARRAGINLARDQYRVRKNGRFGLWLEEIAV